MIYDHTQQLYRKSQHRYTDMLEAKKNMYDFSKEQDFENSSKFLGSINKTHIFHVS